MASPGFGAKQFDAAAAYVELLENLAPGVKDGTISGVVQLKDRTYDGVIRDLAPLDHVRSGSSTTSIRQKS